MQRSLVRYQSLTLLVVVILLAKQGCCKPSKSTEIQDYNGDLPSDYNDEDYTPNDDDTDGPDAVEEPPQITSKPVNLVVKVGSSIILPCLVANAEDLVVVWKKDNEFLYSDSKAMMQEPQRIVRLQNNSLLIHNVTVNDTSDNYTCSILSRPKSITLTHKLSVTEMPVPAPTLPIIHVTPSKNVEVRQGQSITLGCHTNVRPAPLEIKWYRKSEKLRTGKGITVNENHITIHKVTRQDADLYQCLADNGMENPPHAAISVVVMYKPEIEPEREVVHTGTGVGSEMTCIVHAHPRATVIWYKDEQEIIPHKGIMMKHNKSKYTLKISHTSQKDLGKYVCQAMNDLGQSSRTILLTGIPSQATMYGGELTQDNTGIILKWSLESYSPITEYKLNYRRKGDTDWKTVEPRVTDGKGIQYIVEHLIEGLQPGSYEAVLTARNSFGWSPLSALHTFRGEYQTEESASVKASTAVQPVGGVITFLLVVLSCAFTNL